MIAIVLGIANCYRARVTTISKIRYQNLLRLMADPEFRTQTQFGARTGVPPPYISQVLSGERNIGNEVARRIESALGRPEGWMDVPHDGQEPVLKPVADLVPVRRVPLVGWDDIARAGDTSKRGTAKSLSRRGMPLPARRDNAPLIYTAAAVGPRAYAVRVDGDSMFNPQNCSGVPAGAYLVIDPDLAPQDGDFVIVVRADAQAGPQAAFRQLITEAGRRYFRPLNPRYPVEAEWRTARVCGVAVRWELGQDLRVPPPTVRPLRRGKAPSTRS